MDRWVVEERCDATYWRHVATFRSEEAAERKLVRLDNDPSIAVRFGIYRIRRKTIASRPAPLD